MLRTNYALAALSTLNQIRFVLGTEDLNGLDLLPLPPRQNDPTCCILLGRIWMHFGIHSESLVLFCTRLLIYIQCSSCWACWISVWAFLLWLVVLSREQFLWRKFCHPYCYYDYNMLEWSRSTVEFYISLYVFICTVDNYTYRYKIMYPNT